MFTSPASRATPRKSVFRGRGETASVSRGTPSVISERGAITPSTPRNARLNNLKRAASPTSTAGETSKTARYEESAERVYLARDERTEVYSLGSLPREVQQIVKNSDMVRSRIGGNADASSGYAFMTTPNMCVAWNYARRTQTSPTVYVFPAPSSSRPYPSQAPPPVLAALHSPGSGEPGVVLVSPTGEVRFWENTSQALSNVDRHQGVQLDLGGDDYADKVWPVDQNTFIITTTSSLAFRLSINSHSGRASLSATALMRPGGMFGRASSAIFSLGEDRQGVTAVAVDGSSLWMLGARTLQKWQLGSDGQKDVDLHDLVGNALVPARWSTGEIQLEFYDLVPAGQEQMAALVSISDQTAPPQSPSRYAIVLLGAGGRNGALAVSRMVSIAHVPTSDRRILDVPRLIIPANSSTAFIRFSTTVLMVSLAENEEYEETISLNDPKRNAFIGTGHLSSTLLKRPSPPLILMPASGGLMGVDTFSPPISTRSLSSQAAATLRLKSKIEQAVFFGDRPENPLSFDVPANIEGDVAAAAEAVSAEVLSCSSVHMPAIYELRPQLADRLARLKELIAYLRRNGLLVKSSRRLLSRDGEKAKAAVDLWDYQNRLMDQINNRSPQSLLSDSIMAFMDQYGAQEDEDRIRQFFRSQVQYLDRLLELVYSTFNAAVESLGGGRAGSQDRSAWTLETNKIFIIVVRAAAQYREDSLSSYEMDRQSPSIEQWTAQTSLMSALEDLYSRTESLIADRTRDLGSAIDAPPTAADGLAGGSDVKAQRMVQNVLKNQLAELAAALCNNMEDKLRATSRQIADGGEEQEGIALQRKWEEMRPRVIRPLVAIDRVSQAYALAEHHNDFETLVWLCHDAAAGNGVVKLQEYIERFGEEFAFVLYQWYIDQGQHYALLSQDEVYGGLVSKFFAQTDYPELAWLHDLACNRYSAAAADLVVVDKRQISLDAKHIISSIGKLAAVAEMKIKGTSETRKQALVGFDDQLDLVQVQETLRSSLIAPTSARRLAPRDALSAYLEKNLVGLGPRPAFSALVADLARRLVDGKALDIEGLVDVLSLKDNGGEAKGHPGIALDRLRGDRTLPDGRKQVALLSIWRRVFIRDDWAYLSNTAGKSEEKIQEMLRQTLTYSTLKAIADLTSFPTSYTLAPYTSALPPLLPELTARFPDRSPAEIDALMRDHEDEIAVLNRYIDEAGLEARVKEVAVLVRRDAERTKAVEGAVRGRGGDDVDM